MSSLGQGRLRLVPAGGSREPAHIDAQAIVGLTADLVRFSTQGGIDRQEPALSFLADWMNQNGLFVRVLEAPNRQPKNRPLGLLLTIGPPNGPAFCIAACLDTAVVGSLDSWGGMKPNAPRITPDGWMAGRGTADSKVGVAIFTALMVELKKNEHKLKRRLILLVDSDEHTGRFGAVKCLVKEQPNIHGVYIGYPGNQSIKIGARGFYRAKISTYGVASHAGGSNPSEKNAVEKAAILVQAISQSALPVDSDDIEFGVGPRKTVTAISGGRGYSNVPDYCFVRVDYRLTPSFKMAHAKQHLKDVVESVDRCMPTGRDCKIAAEQSWPAYKLSISNPIVSALRDSAEKFGFHPVLKVSGPSNVGNFLSSQGIDAICGFGVTCRGIHAANEAIEVSTIWPIYQSYKLALEKLLL